MNKSPFSITGTLTGKAILKFLDDLVNLAGCANEIRSVMYVGARPCNALYTSVRILKAIRCCIGSQ